MDFLRKNWKVILIGLLGLLLGAIGNYIVNQISNKQLLESLTEQLAQLKIQAQTSRSSDIQNQIISLQAQIDLLQKK